MQFPINLNLDGRRCLLVGGGRIATRKAEQLLACGADLTVIAPHIVDGLRQLPITAIERPYEPGDLDGFRLVITATGDVQVDQQIFDEAEARGIWVNSADDPQRCTFTLPAVVRRGDVMVTASTGGTSPALSTWLRQQLSSVITPEFADIAAELAEERARVHATGASTEDVDWAPIIGAIAARHGIEGLALRTGANAS
ncbi:MAG: bifunctional precorrin-2 dehydrogenase/sirohydrochlorin ferrochelatase [Acidobacteria bacterium]|nr:bifunctional precorrin-2 dehydrogenase/sirohydrochlorin ferrochelatase [Acidobacteriota bacterium]